MDPKPAPSIPYWRWLQVIQASLAMVMTIPGRTQGLGIITNPILEDSLLSLNRTNYAWINLMATLAGAVFAIPFGWLIDRWGIRLILTVNVLLLGIATWFFAQSSSFWTFFLGMFLMRGFGQSALSTSSLTLIGKWFPGRLPQAMAVFGVMSSIGFIALFSTLDFVVKENGWRPAWSSLGYSLIGLSIVFGWLCRNPSPRGTIHIYETKLEATSFTWSQALRSPAFWMFGLSSALFNWVSSGIGLFNVDVLAEAGLEKHFVPAMGTATMVTLFSNGLGGWLSSRWPLPRLMALGMLMLSACLLILPFMTDGWHVYVNAVCLGLSAGMVMVVFFACWGIYFGTNHLGKIQGTAQFLTVLSSALGPVSLAICKDYLGTYRPLFILLAVLSIASALLFQGIRDPRYR